MMVSILSANLKAWGKFNRQYNRRYYTLRFRQVMKPMWLYYPVKIGTRYINQWTLADVIKYVPVKCLSYTQNPLFPYAKTVPKNKNLMFYITAQYVVVFINKNDILKATSQPIEVKKKNFYKDPYDPNFVSYITGSKYLGVTKIALRHRRHRFVNDHNMHLRKWN